MGSGDDVSVKYGADIAGIVSGSKEAAGAVREFTESVKQTAEVAKVFAEAWALEQVFDKVKEFIASMAELGEQTERTAAMIGASTEEVGKLQFLAESTGGSLESMALMMERLGYNAERAAAGNKIEEDAFQRLGVRLKDANGDTKTMTELLLETADAFSKHADGIEKTTLAMQLLGRGGAQMIPVLDEGRAGMQAFMDKAKETGSALSESTVKGMVEVQRSTVEFNAALRGLGATIFSIFQPAIQGVLQQLISLVETLNRAFDSSYTTGSTMKFLAEMVDVVAAAVMALIAAFQLLWDIASAIIDTLSNGLKSLGSEMAMALTGNFKGAADMANASISQMVQTWEHAGSDMGKVLTDYKNNIIAMWAATSSPPTSVFVHGEPEGAGGLPSFAGPSDIAAKSAAAKKALEDLKSTLKGVDTQFQSFFTSVIGGFDKAIGGLITGTMNWKQAMFTVIGSIWDEFVKFIEQWVAKWLAGEATMLVAHQAGVSAKVAADVVGQEDSSALMIANAIKSILVDSKQTFGGVFAFLSPLMGPAAAAPAGAAAATVAGAASFDVGAWNLDRDQLAKVHKGEMIVPAAGGMADSLRSMLAGGGSMAGGADGDTHFHFNGPVLDKNALVKMLMDHAFKNPSVRGKW